MVGNEIDPSLLWGGLLAAIAALAAAIRHIVKNSRPTNGREREMQRNMDQHFQRVERLEDRLRLAELEIAALKAHNE